MIPPGSVPGRPQARGAWGRPARDSAPFNGRSPFFLALARRPRPDFADLNEQFPPGSAKDKILHMGDDLDAPLEDFQECMR